MIGSISYLKTGTPWAQMPALEVEFLTYNVTVASTAAGGHLSKCRNGFCDDDASVAAVPHAEGIGQNPGD